MITYHKRRRRTRCVEQASSAIQRVLSGYEVANNVREHQLVTEWRTIVGDRVAARTWPDGLREGVLWVRVANSAWLQELSFLREQVTQRANELVGNPPLVSSVRFHIGSYRKADADDVVAAMARRMAPRPRRPVRQWAPASPQQAQKIQRETAEVDDAELRNAILAVRLKVGL